MQSFDKIAYFRARSARVLFLPTRSLLFTFQIKLRNLLAAVFKLRNALQVSLHCKKTKAFPVKTDLGSFSSPLWLLIVTTFNKYSRHLQWTNNLTAMPWFDIYTWMLFTCVFFSQDLSRWEITDWEHIQGWMLLYVFLCNSLLYCMASSVSGKDETNPSL